MPCNQQICIVLMKMLYYFIVASVVSIKVPNLAIPKLKIKCVTNIPFCLHYNYENITRNISDQTNLKKRFHNQCDLEYNLLSALKIPVKPKTHCCYMNDT